MGGDYKIISQEVDMTDAIDRRLELRVLDMVVHTQARLGAGFGKYPLGAMDVLEHILPLCRRDDSAWPDIERGMNDLRTTLYIRGFA